VVGVADDQRAAGDGAPHVEDLGEAAAGAEEELDLALAEAQQLQGARRWLWRRLTSRAQPAVAASGSRPSQLPREA
jgi:hypothetical protein